jgi:hypothetical protein
VFMFCVRFRFSCRISRCSLRKCISLQVSSCTSFAFFTQSASSTLLAILLWPHINQEKIQHPHVSALRDIFVSCHLYESLYDYTGFGSVIRFIGLLQICDYK